MTFCTPKLPSWGVERRKKGAEKAVQILASIILDNVTDDTLNTLNIEIVELGPGKSYGSLFYNGIENYDFLVITF